MRIKFSAAIAKDVSRPEDNEDFVEVSEDGLTLAVCDGATESFDSRRWAHLIARRFVADPHVSKSWVKQLSESYYRHYDYDLLSWSQAAAFDRGSFATLVGITHFRDEGRLNVLAIGDSFCALADGDRVLATFPYTLPDQFDTRPTLLWTKIDEAELLPDRRIVLSETHWNLRAVNNPVLLCMTDALGKWFLRSWCDSTNEWQKLMKFKSLDEFQTFVVTERESCRIKVDDTTLVIADEL